MTDDEIREAFAEQTRHLSAKIAAAVATFNATLADANRIQAESEARALAADKRGAVREAAYDERNARAEQRAERQTVAWERIADALATMATKEPANG